MSTIKVNTITDANGGSNVVLQGVASPPNGMGFRNRIINGDMRIDQRNAGASVTQTTGNQFAVDRFLVVGSVTSKFTAQQSSTAPIGFTNSIICTSSSAYSVGAAETFIFAQRIEGFNIADLGWGTANAQTVTLSFWVRSSLTGTFGGAIRNSAANRSYPFTYTISASNIFEYKTVTIDGDTTGTWLTDNGLGINLVFSLGTGATLSGTADAWAGANYLSATGATSVVATASATLNITGVQLEAGSVASPFERRDIGRELMMCQRYCFRAVNYDLGNAQNSAYTYYPVVRLPVTMRASASYTASSGTFTVNAGSAGVPALNFASVDTVLFYNSSSNWTVTAFVQVSATLTAEL